MDSPAFSDSPAARGGLRSRVVTRIEDLEARAWDSIVTSAGMRHAAIRVVGDVSLDAPPPVYALVSDRAGPYAVIAGRPHVESPMLRRVLNVSAPLGRFGGIQLREGVTLDTALPRLFGALGKMARLRRCAAYAIYAPTSEAPVFAKHGCVRFDGPSANRSDLSAFPSYEAFVAKLPRCGHELRRGRRRSEQFGLRFEVTSPPRADTKRLVELLRATFDAHRERMPYTSDFFERVWAVPFAEHVLLAAYHGDRLVAASWSYRSGSVMTASLAAIDYEVARPSYAYFTLLDEIIRHAFANGVKTIEWGISNDAIKSRYGAEAVPGFAAVRPAVPLPSPVWRGVRAILAHPRAARALGVADEAESAS